MAGTPFDFTTPRIIGERIDANDEQLRLGAGYDHNFVLDSTDGSLALAATATDPGSGRVLEVLTTEPGLQFYTGNFFAEKIRGKAGSSDIHRSDFWLETQHFPDAVNQPSFPNTVLCPGQTYRSTTVDRFSAS